MPKSLSQALLLQNVLKIPRQAKIITYRTLLISSLNAQGLLFDRPNNRNTNEHAATRVDMCRL